MSEQFQNGQVAAESEDIVVTARKRSERLIDIPQSVSAISADQLDKLSATQFRDFANTVPGLEFTTTGVGQNQISIRGVTTGLTGSQTVGVYVDDVPYGASGSYAQAGQLGFDQGLFDLDHVEVLRGPQGTLYGASALGGVIKYVTVVPDTNSFGGNAQAGVSTTRFGDVNYNGAAAVNVPIAKDKAAVRVSGYYSHEGGYIDNIGLNDEDVNRSRVYGARLDLLLKPTDRLSVRLVGTGQNIRREGSSTVDYDFDGTPRYGNLKQNRIFPEPFDQRFRLVSGTIKYDFDSFALTSVSSYQTIGSTIRGDFSALYVPLLGGSGLPLQSVGVTADVDTHKFAQEVRLQSTNSGFVEWLIGGFYTHEDNRQHQFITATNPDGTPSNLPLSDAHLPNTYEEYAGFGNITLHLTDKLQVTGGIRYAHSNQSYEQKAAAGQLLIQPLPEAKSDENTTTWLANAQYSLSPNANVYFRYATGYRPGGPNAVLSDPDTGQPLAPPTFASDKLQSYEGGFKAQTADKTFAIDLDGYYINWDNIQIVTARNGIAVVANASAPAHIYGSDLTATLRPSPDFTVTGAFGYIHARLTAADAGLGARKDERLPNVPDFTATVSADYVVSSVSFKPRFGATVRHVSNRSASFDASPSFPQYDLGDYVSVDLRAGVTFGPVDAQIFARNLFDVRGQLSADTRLSVLGGPAQVAVLQPRTIGLSLSTHF